MQMKSHVSSRNCIDTNLNYSEQRDDICNFCYRKQKYDQDGSKIEPW